MTLLECENLSIGYGSKIIQKNLNISIQSGDYFFIIGENGAGKSTLLKTILGFEPPISGKITFTEGFEKGRVGYLPQQNSSLKEFPATVEEIVLSGCNGKLGLFPFYSKEHKKTAHENMEKLGILEFKNKSFNELSGGQQQRVLLARALCAAEKLLILDEPIKGFDSKITEEMYKDILELNKSGMTIIMISHDLEAAKKYATQTLELKRVRV